MTDQKRQELDAAVSAALFGEEWPVHLLVLRAREHDWWCIGTRPDEDGLHREEASRRVNDYLPRYSSDIAAAWIVVEWLRAKGLQLMTSTFDQVGWLASIVAWDTSYGETAPEAICRVALGWARRSQE